MNDFFYRNPHLQIHPSKTYDHHLLTIIESPVFSKLWPDYWTRQEHGDFMSYLAANPDAGAVIPGSGGCRKVRWGMTGSGKSGAVRVIYTAQLANGVLVALLIYAKGATENIPAHLLRKISRELGNASD